MQPTRTRWWLAAVVGLLLVIFASRVVRLRTLEMDRDEVWSVWQTFGSPQQIVNWTPYDWSPLFYLMVGGWHELTGIHPFVVRLLPVFGFLIGAAILYRVARRLCGDDLPALIAVAACAALGYGVHIGLLVRAYSLLFSLALLAWWLALRYFTCPTIRRAVPLAVCMAVMFYMHVTSLFALAWLLVFTLFLYGVRVWRWILPTAAAVILALPEILSKYRLASGRAATGAPILEQWLSGGATIIWQQLLAILRDFAGYGFAMWAAFVAIAAALILDRYRLQRRVLALAVWLAAPIPMFIMGLFDAYTNRHLAWVMPAFAIWIGWGMARLPKAGIAGLMLVLVITMFGPIPTSERYKTVAAPLVTAFNFLADHTQPGDALVVDPNLQEVGAEEWDYYTRAFFPNGLKFVADPGPRRRVWYASVEERQDPPTIDRVRQNRYATDSFAGENHFSLRLYIAPPDLAGVVFANGMRFHGAEPIGPISPLPVWHEGETLRVRLWWSADRQIDLDYSVGTYVSSANGFVAQFDGPPQVIDGPQETSRWVTGRYYVEEREISLPNPLPTGNFPLLLSVYQWWDGKRLTAPGTNADDLLPLLVVHIISW